VMNSRSKMAMERVWVVVVIRFLYSNVLWEYGNGWFLEYEKSNDSIFY
jgi:hypothetical protein